MRPGRHAARAFVYWPLLGDTGPKRPYRYRLSPHGAHGDSKYGTYQQL